MQFTNTTLAAMSFKRTLLQVELLQQFFVHCAVNDTPGKCKYAL